jgi:DNA-binding GntR family transcriptional regulator
MSTAARKVKRRPRTALQADTLTEQAYNRLEEMIVTLALAPGAVLSEQALCSELGIGRTPIREALQRLAREGLVRVMPRKAIIVTETDPRRQLLVLEVRRPLERLLAGTSAERASAAERMRFESIASGMEAAARSSDDLAFMRLDRALNALLTEAAHNEYAARAVRMLNGHSRRFWYLHYRETADLPKIARLHADQARAISAGSAAQAMTLTDKLIDYVESFTRATLAIGHSVAPQ